MKPILQLSITVAYDPDGYDKKVASSHLIEAAEHMVSRGMITGNTPMTVEQWDAEVLDLSAEEEAHE